MPAQKRAPPANNANEEDSGRRRRHLPHHNGKPPRVDRDETSEEEDEEVEEEDDRQKKDVNDDDEEEEEEEEGDDAEDQADGEVKGEEGEREDSEDYPSSSSGEKPEFVYVDLTEIRNDVQCPICLGIIRKTRTVMECLHRFCRECIDKSMRLGNNECPACRKHCASRRSLRDDPNFDALIAVLYPDIDKYEEEELAFHEEEKARNKEIQASIALVFQRQTEALSKRRSTGKDAASGFLPRPQRNLRTNNARRKRNSRAAELHAYEDNEEENGGKDTSSGDERLNEVRQRKKRKRTGARSSLPSSSADGGDMDNDTEPKRESRGISPGLVWNTEMLAWGRGGTRSNTRHGGSNGGKSSRSTRLSKLTEHLRSLEETEELDVHLMLISLDKETTPSLKLPHVCSRSSLSVRQLCEYIALQTALQANEVEIFVSKSQQNPSLIKSAFKNGVILSSLDLSSEEDLQLVEEKESLASIRANYLSTHSHLILAYRKKKNPAIS